MQINIDYEISQLRDAVFGEDVRSAFISCMEKLHTVSETNANIVIEAERTMNEIRDNAVNALNDLTSRLEAGEFIGPPGPQGLPGKKGDTGETGNTGERGSKWMRGTAITGIDPNGIEFPNSGIENALVGDFFINTSTSDIYECVKSGNSSVAKWAYIGNIKGKKGDRGDVGPQGTVENIDDQILTFESAENLENVKSGETVKITFGKLMKAVGTFIVHHTQKATTSILGHIKITNSAAVTDSTGLALAATEKNAAISGTLAHQIAQISAQNNDFANNITQLNSNMMNKGNFIDAWISKNIKIGGADDADYPASVNNQIPFDNYHKTGESFTLLPDGSIQCNRAGTVIAFLQIVDTPELVGMNLIYKLSSRNAPYSHEKRFGFRPTALSLRATMALNVYTVQNGTIITCEAVNYTAASNVIINGINPYNTRIMCILY